MQGMNEIGDLSCFTYNQEGEHDEDVMDDVYLCISGASSVVIEKEKSKRVVVKVIVYKVIKENNQGKGYADRLGITLVFCRCSMWFEPNLHKYFLLLCHPLIPFPSPLPFSHLYFLTFLLSSGHAMPSPRASIDFSF